MRGSDGPRAIARNGEVCGGRRQVVQRTIEPSIFGGLHAGRAGFHEVLRVEVRARRVRRSGGVHDGEMPLLPERLKRRQRRMQSKEAVEIDHRLARNVDAGPHRVILRLGVRHDDVQSIGRTALEDHDQALGAARRFDSAESSARQKARHGRRADDGKRAVAKKYATSDGMETAPGT